ncbi:MAG: Hsp20/alpha crystallin family protein [Candidatus Aegiribacteria sp.]|nr:Hsp20/alpha crystallin family protein [Candidatus Aegiribacteria sp.]
MFLLREGDISWTPAVDMYEAEKQWLLFVELPGVSSDDIDLIIFPESVLIRGIKTPPVKALTAEKIEIYTGHFHREIHIPGRISITEVTASLKNGVLSLILTADEQTGVRSPVNKSGESIKIEKGD